MVGAAMESRVVGWRERIALPQLGIESLVAKVDTGARSSALHVLDLSVEAGRVRFLVPLDRTATATVPCEADLVGWRWVRDSGGHGTLRPVVRTRVELGADAWDEEVTLADRAGMQHRMLLGRVAVRGRFLVDPEASFVRSEAPVAASVVPEAA